MTTQFVYTGLPARVIFGRKTKAALPDEVARLGFSRPMIVSSSFQAREAQKLQQLFGGNRAELYTNATMHTPTTITDEALEKFQSANADGIISFGGGSSIGLGKALSLRTGAAHIAIPTTYAGSEMTPILGETSEGQKVTQKTEKVLPQVVIYDVDHTLSLPLNMVVASGLNAIAHAVEALYAEQANPVLALLAEDGIRRLSCAIPNIIANPEEISARTEALHGAWLCAMCLGAGGVALHHKICHVLGGMFDLPHAETHAVVLPHAIAFNAPAIPKTMEVLRRAMAVDDPAARLFEIAHTAGLPTSLDALGMPESGIEKALEQALANPYYNPRTPEPVALQQMIAAAWSGAHPTKLK